MASVKYSRDLANQAMARIENEIAGQFSANNGPLLDLLARSRIQSADALVAIAIVETRDPNIKKYQDIIRRHLDLIESIKTMVNEGQEAWHDLSGRDQNDVQDEIYPPRSET